MTLIVSLISVAHKDISHYEQQIRPPHNDLFGSEVWRVEVWGHPVIKDLGCHYLADLKNSNIYVFDEEIHALEHEVRKVLENIEMVEKQTGIVGEALRFRLDNALEVIRVAKQFPDKLGVGIF